MQTRVVKIDPEALDPIVLEEAGRVIRSGGLVAFPTETVYGLGANALDVTAVKRIFEAKERPAEDPLIVHLAEVSAIAPLVRRVPAVLERLKVFWPGPLTLVLPRSQRVPLEVSAGLDSVAIRIPAHPVARGLVRAAGVPIAAPSANRFTRPSPTCAQHVLDDLEGRFPLLLDGGSTWHGVESTVVDLTGPNPILLRPGAVTFEAIRAVAPNLEVAESIAVGSPGGPMRSPGTHLKHYSPRAAVQLFVGGTPERVLSEMEKYIEAHLSRGVRVGLMLHDEWLVRFEHLPITRVGLGAQARLEDAASRLYGALRRLDQAGVDVIVTAGHSKEGLGRTLQDRLLRAAEGKVIMV